VSTTQDRAAAGFRERLAVKGRLGLGRGLGEEFQQEKLGLLALAFGGLEEAAQDAVVFQAFFERVLWITLRMITTGRRLCSAWLLVGGTRDAGSK